MSDIRKLIEAIEWNHLPDAELLHILLEYNGDSGIFKWEATHDPS